jgi:hypothetical protein
MFHLNKYIDYVSFLYFRVVQLTAQSQCKVIESEIGKISIIGQISLQPQYLHNN